MIALVLCALALSACATAAHHAYTPAPGSYFVVSVRSGDTVSEIAYRYRVNENDLVSINRLRDRDSLFPGQVLKVPAYGRVARGYREPPRPQPRTTVTRKPAQTRVAHVSPAKPVPKPQSSAITRVSLHAPQAAHNDPSAQFAWPLDGVVVSGFGSQQNGERNDGINIACTGGEEIKAAASGTVTYVGNELKGYGNLVLIRHDNGYITAYAHADRVVVNKGERVSQGQVIAYAGSTGDVAEPQLHFELRRGTTPVDPRPHLLAYRS